MIALGRCRETSDRPRPANVHVSSGISPGRLFAAYQAFSAGVALDDAPLRLAEATGIPMRIQYGRAALPCTSAVTKPASTCSEITALAHAAAATLQPVAQAVSSSTAMGRSDHQVCAIAPAECCAS